MTLIERGEYRRVIGAIIAGIWIRPLGVAAAVGLLAYFLAAIIGHLRVGDRKGIMMPLPTLVLSAAALVLGIATL